MFGGISLDGATLPITLIRFFFIFLLIFFLSCVWYWFLRTRKIPSLALVLRTMFYSTKWFPILFVHRIRILPARVKKITARSREPISAYPVFRSRKRTERKKFVRKKR